MSSQDIDPRLRALSTPSQLPNLQPNPSHAPSSSAISNDSTPSLPPYPPIPTEASPTESPAYYAHTPQPGSNHETAQNDAKRPRACEACRGLKVRCDPDPNGGPCKRCAKANRACEITQPSRKRQKKTDSRVADLEKKIEILQRLTASIHPKSAETALLGLDSQAQHTTPYQPRPDNAHSVPPKPVSDDWSPYSKRIGADTAKVMPMVVEAGRQKRQHDGSPNMTSLASASKSIPSKATEPQVLLEQLGTVFSGNADRSLLASIYSDVIDRQMVSLVQAEQIFRYYNEHMAIHLPAVVFPKGTIMSTVRKEKPVLLLAILVAGAGPIYPDLQHNLNRELTSVFATRIMINGEKSLELVQALHVSTLWYCPPEHFEELKFYQLVHIAAVMAIDIGMGKPNRPAKAGASTAGIFRDNPWRKQPFPDSDSIEARRAWLCCYFLCGNTSMGLRRPNLIRWTPYMADCVRVLENSPEAFPSDINFCAWIRSQHIAEEVGYQFSMDDPSAKISISDDKVNYALKKFEQDLAQWHAEIPNEARSGSLEMTGHIISLYMHEIAMHVDHNIDEFKPPYHESTIGGLVADTKSTQPLTTSHVEALSACLTAIDGVFEIFLSHDVATIRCLPVANFVRVAYTTVVLMKLSLAASNPENAIGKIFVASKLRTEEYLDGLIQLFNAAAADQKSKPSSKFLMVLVMLKTWFQRRIRGSKKAEDSEGHLAQSSSGREATQNHLSNGGQSTKGDRELVQSYSSTNTPLDVLSEVATGNSRRHSSIPNQYSGPSDGWQTGLQNQYQSYPVNMAQQNFSDELGIDVNNLSGFEYNPDNLDEAAIGMMAEFGAYVGDNNFFMGNGYGYANF